MRRSKSLKTRLSHSRSNTAVWYYYSDVCPLIQANKIRSFNFLAYWNRRIVFCKSVDASNKIHNANCIVGLMDTAVVEVRVKYYR